MKKRECSKKKQLLLLLCTVLLYGLGSYLSYVLEEMFHFGGIFTVLFPSVYLMGLFLFSYMKKRKKQEKTTSEVPLAPKNRVFWDFEKQRSYKDLLSLALLFSSSVLWMAPLRLLSDKVLFLLHLEPVHVAEYMFSVPFAFLFYVLIPAVLLEVFHRKWVFFRLEHARVSKKTVLFLSALFYTLTLPQMNNLLPHFVFGGMLALLFYEKRSLFLNILCSILMNLLSLFYNMATQEGNAGGEAMSFPDIAGLSLIFAGMAVVISYFSLKMMRKKKMIFWEVFTVLLVGILLFLSGMVTVALV